MNIDDYQLYTLIVDGELRKKPHLQHTALKIVVFKSAIPPWFHPPVTFNFPSPYRHRSLGVKGQSRHGRQVPQMSRVSDAAGRWFPLFSCISTYSRF